MKRCRGVAYVNSGFRLTDRQSVWLSLSVRRVGGALMSWDKIGTPAHSLAIFGNRL